MDFETVFIIAIMVLGFSAWKFIPRFIAQVPFVQPAEVMKAMGENRIEVIIDVRAHGDYIGDSGHIEGAINLPYGYMSERLTKVEQDLGPYKHEPILIAAGGDTLAAHSARLLRKIGFSNIAILKGGMKRWSNMGMPVEHGLPADAEIKMD
ncbi:MAG: rhodanese-like domain-containing protein [Alphaproteobacteria bacterium]|jgi:3-mercaptopyruvate sulfurtransferase SseA|nr:rhodanese-like domain-containing protein [Alphaproteobacteria bacterium]